MLKRVIYLINYNLYRIYYCYSFIYAHKPLCGRFKKDVLNFFNRLYICRGCFFVYFGILLTLILGFVKDFVNPSIYILSGILIIVGLSYPKIYKHFPRFFKDIVRFFNGMFIGYLVLLGFHGYLLLCMAGILTFTVLKKIYNKMRTIEKANACEGCIELQQNKTCSGYSLQVKQMLILENAFSKKINILNKF